ncbi:hypothetical protein EWM64_g237 [Hericium alpestre]|uniref:Uncharacterized protein n=1 Tax=Hericium alpestre TaxID=135208 RepID=A0A4Z0ABU3_9AGAM|nr:hypothetical protein EWM64_g237 [Hericium alpestre]
MMASDCMLPGQPVPLPRGPAPQLGAGIYTKDGQTRASLVGVPRYDGPQALVSITVVDGVPLPAGEEFTGVIRVQDVRATEKDKVKIADCFRGGDVISLGDARSYYITTARNDLGVIFATSEAAVLSASNALHKENIMGSHDDSYLNFSSQTDWKSKYYEVADMLAETKTELDEFHQSSKELEEELERELARTEKAQQDLKVKIERSENERDEWKAKFVSLQTMHNTTTTSLQRELDTLRQVHQKLKVELRELEMGNDDLERNERAVSSSLADIEAKYSRALEEKILLEHELLDKAGLEEECQRLRDELREEVSIIRDQLEAAQARGSSTTESPTTEDASSAPSSLLPHISERSDDDLLHTQPPPDLQLSDLSPEYELPSPIIETPRLSSSSLSSDAGQSALLQRAGFALPRPKYTAPQSPTTPTLSMPTTPISRASTLPSLSTPSRLPPPRTTVTRATPRIPVAASMGASTSSTVNGAGSKNKGVQMVSEMRARVRNLEQKIHTRVPRLRMGSTSRPAPPASSSSSSTVKASGLATAGSHSSNSSLHRTSEDRTRPSTLGRSSAEYDDKKRTPAGDSTGWVLIMEDSPSPVKSKDKLPRRGSTASSTHFRPYASTAARSHSPSPTFDHRDDLSRSAMLSGLRRPQSRQSTSTEGRSSISTTATVSTIPTPVSRPTTPTFLPVPSAGLYAHASTAGVAGLKRSTGPGAGGPYSNQKRSSLGSSSAGSPTSTSFTPESGIPHRNFSSSVMRSTGPDYNSSPSSFRDPNKVLPALPHSNVTVRSTKLPSPSLSQSRIGRPTFGGRKSAAEDAFDAEGRFLDTHGTRPRSGSSAPFR